MSIKKTLSFVLLLITCCIVQGCFNRAFLKKKKPIRLLREAQKERVTYKHLKLSSRINVTLNNKEQKLKGKFELEHQKHLLTTLSALGLNVSKVLIKPDHITFYEKLSKQYYDGSKVKLLNKIIGLDLDITTLQNLLLGNPLVEIINVNGLISRRKSPFVLVKGKLNKNLSFLIFINKKTKKVTKQQLVFKKISLVASYKDFSKEYNNIPRQVHIEVKKDSHPLIELRINYKKIKFLDHNTYKINIPKNYKEIKF